MPRLEDIDEVLFPVEERSVYVRVGSGEQVRHVSVPDTKAIVNVATGRVLGIVGGAYRLVTNQQALEWGRQCCAAAFPDTRDSEWVVRDADAPASGGHCFIDLVHSRGGLDFDVGSARGRPEAYAPFVRVVNSYNGVRALSFSIGYYRLVCTNGLIVRDTVIRFRFVHGKRHIGQDIDFLVDRRVLQTLTTRFAANMGVLRTCNIDAKQSRALVESALRIREPGNRETDARVAADWRTLVCHIDDLINKYQRELGPNAYAVLNAMTEFASHPPTNRCVYRDRNSYQKLAGEWAAAFSKECLVPGFSVEKYLADLTHASQTPATTTTASRRGDV